MLLQKLFFEALCRNNVLFVSLLMEYGASIEELTDEQLFIIFVTTMVNQTKMLCTMQSFSIRFLLILERQCFAYRFKVEQR